MNAGHPTVRALVVDAVRRLRRPLAPTFVGVLIAFAATVAIFATTGQALASQQRTLDRLNSPAGRLVTVSDQQGDAGLAPVSVDVVRSLTGVDWAFAVGPAVDVQNANLDGGQTVAARVVYGEMPPPVTVELHRRLLPGQAVAAPGIAARLGLASGTGAVGSRTLDAVVVDSFTAAEPLTALNGNVLVAADPDDPVGRVLTLWVSVHDVSQVAAVADAVRGGLVASNPGALQIDTATELPSLSGDIVDEIVRSARLTLGGLLLAVVVLVGVVQHGRVVATTRDIGRRRALGATRSTIMVHVVLIAGMSAALGTMFGVGVGLAIDDLVAGALPAPSFSAAVAVLAVLAALIGSVPSALRASRLDPVAILRVP